MFHNESLTGYSVQGNLANTQVRRVTYAPDLQPSPPRPGEPVLRRRRTLALERRPFVELTDARTGVAHQVTEQAHDAGVLERRGLFTAVCDHRLLAAALTAAPDRRCAACLDAADLPAGP